jgi:arylsulfatase
MPARLLPFHRTVGSLFGEPSHLRHKLLLALFLVTQVVSPTTADENPATSRRPNIVVILADDLGYGDLGSFGAKDIRTPHLDCLAADGTKFTSFYVPQAVCTASRAGLMSGCYLNRIGLAGALNHTSRVGIHPDEWLLPEMLQDRGYATCCVGKWHLGTVTRFSAPRNGFDAWLGIPYSNDNSKFHPVLAAEMPPLPLIDGERVVEHDPDQSQFTRRFTERAVRFIEEHAAQPFFLYLPHVMPHVPIFASAEFRGRSRRGLYGDVVEELDASVGQIVATLERLKLADNTLIVFFSDNGPWLSYGDHAGSAGPLREGKLTAFEGGVRVPCLARWPGRIPAGSVCDEPVLSLDLLPTIAAIVGGKQSQRVIDGRDIRPLMLGEANARSPHEALFFYAGDELHAVRSGPWKLHFPHPYLTTAGEPGRGGKPSNWGKTQPKSITESGMEGIASRHGQKVARLELSLFHLLDDPGETKNLAAEHPDVVQRLTQLAEPIRAALGDALTGQKGTARRAAGLEP